MARTAAKLVVCIKNDGYEASLERRKLYLSLPDVDAEKSGYVRVIDESGEDYLFPRRYFKPVELPRSARRAVLLAA